MKLRILPILGFIGLLITLLIVTVPAKQVIYRIDFPPDLGVYEVSGTIWKGTAASALVHNQTLNNVSWNLSFWPLLTGQVHLEITSNKRNSVAVNGSVNLGLISQQLIFDDVKIQLPAELIFTQAPLPVPVIGAGTVNIRINSGRFDLTQAMPTCLDLDAQGIWNNAGVLATNGMVDLGQFDAQMTCSNEQYRISVEEPNGLGLSFIATGNNPQNLSVNGQFKLPDSLPEDMQRVGQFLGQPDATGYSQFTW